jgi:hypothetical protein
VDHCERSDAVTSSTQTVFTNAVLAARKAGISDQQLAAIAGMRESEIAQIPGTR